MTGSCCGAEIIWHHLCQVVALSFLLSCINLLRFQWWKISGDNSYHPVVLEEDQEENQVSCFTVINVIACVLLVVSCCFFFRKLCVVFAFGIHCEPFEKKEKSFALKRLFGTYWQKTFISMLSNVSSYLFRLNVSYLNVIPTRQGGSQWKRDSW